MKSVIRISALLWADALVAYAFFVMQKYLTEVWKLSFTHAAGILNVWLGISKILQVFFLFLVDSLLGNFKMLLISSVAYTLGVSFVAMSTPPVLANFTNTCKEYEPQCIGHTQKFLFYIGMALVAVGMAGNSVSAKPFLEEQQDKSNDDSDELQDLFKELAWLIYIPIFGAIALPHVKSWSLQFGIPAIFTAFATLHFLSGSLDYDKDEPKGSPLTNVCRVFVAFVSKKSLPLPPDSNQLYKKDDENRQSFSHSHVLRCLEKAAIILPDTKLEDQVKNRWKLCSLEEVEEAKFVVRMMPAWINYIVCGIVSSMRNTYFVEQANHMNRRLGNWNVPLQILLLFYNAYGFFSQFTCILLMNSTRGLVYSILCCGTAAVIEKRRLNAIKNHGLLDKPEAEIPMSVFWLLFQFCLLGGLDSYFTRMFTLFRSPRTPSSMENYLLVFINAASGLGYMFNVLTVHIVGKVSERGGGRNWFQYTSNGSRLDRFYWVLAVLSGVSLVVLFVYCIAEFCYRESCYRDKKRPDDADA